MWFKRILTAGLLLFVGVTLGVIVSRGERPATAPAASVETTEAAGELDKAATEVTAAPPIRDGVVVTYFHSQTRCPTCRTIESLAHEAVESRFADELAGGSVQWRTLSYEAPANQQQAERYQVLAPTVVVSRVAQGQETGWSRLDRVWQLTDDRAAFADYVQEEMLKLWPTASR
ncbi:MAG: hypothetical protein J5I93_04045 [Pirellulaceae bacterium]|nr:hypothetical protein [Pirellulaceae bacterium]